jgi:polysaccharide export outer membrane protein
VAAALACAVAASGCNRAGKFIWVDAVPRGLAAQEIASTIGAGDVISIRVWNQEANSVDRVRVREDGRISMPFLNDVEVAGVEPQDLARRLEVKLKSFIVNPVVTVVINERRPTRVTVMGNVARPGIYELDPRSGVLTALAAAGGPTAFAASDGIFVLRSGYWADGDPSPGRIRFRYDDLSHGKPAAANFQLRSGDAVIVE